MHDDARPLWRQMHRSHADRILGAFGISKPPVDVFGLARDIGADLRFRRGAQWDGATDTTVPAQAVIYVSADCSSTRQRFAAAHGIGHLVLHGSGRVFRDDFSAPVTDLVEIQANNFAADLLMPSWMVAAFLRQTRSAATLADVFEVSEDAMRYRLASLGHTGIR